MIYIFYHSTPTIVCWRNTVWKSSLITFFCGGDPFCEGVRWPENTQDMFAWMTRRSLPSLESPADLFPSLKRPTQLSPSFERPAALSPSLQNYRLYIVFSSPMWKYEYPLRLTYWLVIGTYILPFFPAICLFYL